MPLLALVSFASIAQKPVKEKKIRKYAETIKAEELREKLTIIASAEMEGRETATPGQKKAAAYIENKFRELGLKPGNGDSYQMFYDVFQDSLTNVSFTINGNSLKMDGDYSFSVASAPNGSWKIDSIVFAGLGTVNKKTDDYSDVDVKDKWVFVHEGSGSLVVIRQKSLAAKSKGAKGLFIVSKNFPRRTATSTKSQMYIEAVAEFPTFFVSYDVISGMLATPVTDSIALSKLTKKTYTANANLSIAKQKLTLQSSNVMGFLEGKDKKDEYVVLTAHYDHIGKRGDSVIYYGADDDGSGTTAIIELAEAFVSAKKKGDGPGRSILFMAVSGEEKGLWGSEIYTEKPVYPLNKTTVNLNIDMIGRTDPKYKGDSVNYIYIIGDDKLSSDLAPITDSINKHYINMELDRRYNDIKDPNRYFYRSDHYNFAAKGVPIIFYFNGTHADYHRPTDTVDKINFELMQKRTKLVFYTAWEMANRNDMLKRDIPLNVPPRNSNQ